MVAIMTSTPLAMKQRGFGYDDTTSTVECHQLGMFLPALVTGDFIRVFGASRIVVAGYLLLTGGVCLYLIGYSLGYYILPMVVLGVGWNWSFISSTALLNKLYAPSERPTVQGFNDFVILLWVFVLVLSSSSFIVSCLQHWNTTHAHAITLLCLAQSRLGELLILPYCALHRRLSIVRSLRRRL
jgi:MFS family permease